ncbi:hypothetical protein KJK34_03875 [Flavobacterium sp. D11R37]|uniref:hypothetical protein n=1 Tax=Flavobacterium coralii TaxID=2838017 RepID=UPI001CA61702|nr:hypothetical protein [Flavobacterium coralii]MBY8961883.1 hypothetical protein [Flavobacterium coralii]
MKTITFKFLALFLLFPIASIASGPKGKYTKERKINKLYNVNSSAQLDVDNRYGNVYITTWDKNQTAIDVVITVTGNDEALVVKRFNSIDVIFNASQNSVSADTEIRNISCENVGMEINYTIKIPKRSPVTIENEYGGIILGKLYAPANLNCKFGDIKAEELNDADNIIKMEYCGASRIGYWKGGNILAKFSGLNIEKGAELNVNSEYTNITLGEINTIKHDCKYGDLYIKNGNTITGTCDYLQMKVGNVSSLLNVTIKFGNINVQHVEQAVKAIYINASYTGVRLNYDKNFAFTFVFSLNYGNLNGSNDLKFTEKKEKMMGATYKGYYKSANGSSVTIRSEYGDINLKTT